MPNVNKCIVEATALAKQLFKGQKISNKRIEDIADQLRNHYNAQKRLNPELSDTEAYQRAADTLINDHTRALDQIDRRLKLQAIRTKANYEHMERFNWSRKGLQAILDGVENTKTGARNGLQQRILSMYQRFVGGKNGWMKRITEMGLDKDFKNPNNEEMIAQTVLDMMNENAPPENIPQSIKDIAKIIIDKNERERTFQNAYGADIPRNFNRIATTRWNRIKMKKLGFDAVWALEQPLIDWDRSFPEIAPEDLEQAFKEWFTEITSGIRIKNSPESINDAVGYSKFYRALHQRRVFYFKDGAGWLRHQREIGESSLVDSLNSDTMRAAKNVGMLKQMGPYAYEQWDILKNETAKRGNLTQLQAKMLDNIFKDLDGTTSQVLSYTIAHSVSTIMHYQAWRSLGLVTLRSLPDLANTWMTLRYNGIGLADRTIETLRSFMSFFKQPADLKEFLDIVQTGAQARIGDYNRFQAGSVQNGAISQINRLFYRINGLTRWDRTLKATMSQSLARYLAIRRKTAFDDLHPFTQRALNRNAIGQKEWDLLRAHPLKLQNNKYMILPDSADEITDDEIKSYLGKEKPTQREIEFARDEIHDRLMMYYLDNERHVIMDSGATERSYLGFGMQRGHPVREVINLFGQFKTYPIGFARRVLGRELSAGLGDKTDLAGLMQLAVTTGIFSLLGYSATEFLKGKVPDLTNPRSLVEAVAPSFGIYGDLLRNEMDNYNSSFIKGMLGPIANTFDDTAKFVGEIASWKKPGMATLRFAKHNLPFMNLWMINTLVRHYLFDAISDNIEPGSVERTRRYLENLTGEKDLFNQ